MVSQTIIITPIRKEVIVKEKDLSTFDNIKNEEFEFSLRVIAAMLNHNSQEKILLAIREQFSKFI